MFGAATTTVTSGSKYTVAMQNLILWFFFYSSIIALTVNTIASLIEN